jgi:hypothetical protein
MRVNGIPALPNPPIMTVEPSFTSLKSDTAIIARLIAASARAIPVPAACPYDTDRAGCSCGGRSAYSRPGGYEPLCYPKDDALQRLVVHEVARWMPVLRAASH